MTGSRLDIDMQVLKYLIYFHLFLINNLTSKRESELGYIASADFAFIWIERRNHLAMLSSSLRCCQVTGSGFLFRELFQKTYPDA